MVSEKKKDEVVRQEQQDYTPSEEVQQAQQQMQQQQAQQPGQYVQSDAVTSAQQALQNVQNNKPASYNSRYGAALDNILQQIQNPKDFKYSFDGDELFKLYADQYTRRGKQASLDAMGQAATLTGGYGNSYAQQVGNQTYDQYLMDLYDKGLDLRDRAYQQYQDQLANQYNQFNVLNTADQSDYAKYRDLVGDWENERTYLTNRADTERNFDYNQYMDQYNQWVNNRDYYTNQYNTLSQQDYSRYADARDYAEQQYQFDKNMQETIRQFDANLDWEKMSASQKQAAEYAMNILANGKMPSSALLKKAGLSTADAKKLKAQIKKSGGSGSGSSNTYYVDNQGNYYTYKNGQWVYVPDKNVKSTDKVNITQRDYLDTVTMNRAKEVNNMDLSKITEEKKIKGGKGNAV